MAFSIKEVWGKFVEFLRRYFRYILTVIILGVCAYTFYFYRPRIFKDAGYYITRGDDEFEKFNYGEALALYRNARYYAPDSFDVNFKIAKTLIIMPPEKDHGYLIRYYLSESLKTVQTLEQIQLVTNVWSTNAQPVLTQKFASYGITPEVRAEFYNTITEERDRLVTTLENLCDAYDKCLKIADTALGNNDLDKAEKFLVKAVFEDKSKDAAAHFQSAILYFAKIYFQKYKGCSNVSWEAAIKNDKHDNVQLNGQLAAYSKLRSDDCNQSSLAFANKLKSDLEALKDDPKVLESDPYLRASVYVGTINLLGTNDPSSIAEKWFSVDRGEKNRRIVTQSIDSLYKFYAFDGAAPLYEKAGKHIKTWFKISNYEFKARAKKLLEFSMKLYARDKNQAKVEHLKAQIASIR